MCGCKGHTPDHKCSLQNDAMAVHCVIGAGQSVREDAGAGGAICQAAQRSSTSAGAVRRKNRNRSLASSLQAIKILLTPKYPPLPLAPYTNPMTPNHRSQRPSATPPPPHPAPSRAKYRSRYFGNHVQIHPLRAANIALKLLRNLLHPPHAPDHPQRHPTSPNTFHTL